MRDVIEVIKTRRYKAGYEVREEKILTHFEDKPKGHTFTMESAYTPLGDYIGRSRDAYRLCKKRGIKPEKANPSHDVCSIGFSNMDNKWYGWSHRAIHGFKIGDIVQKGDCVNSSGWTEEYLQAHPEEDLSLPIGFVAHSIEDTKRMAIAFADSVG